MVYGFPSRNDPRDLPATVAPACLSRRVRERDAQLARSAQRLAITLDSVDAYISKYRARRETVKKHTDNGKGSV